MGGAKKSISEIRNIACSNRTLIKIRLEEGDISQKIIEAAKEEQCDLIILGSKKKKGIKRLFGDNILKKVINNSPCPVLVVSKDE